MNDEIIFEHKPSAEKAEQGKEEAALHGIIAKQTEAGKGPFIFAPTETPDEYQSLYEKIAALNQVNKIYVPRAKTSSKFYLDKYISALGSRTEFPQNFFDEYDTDTWNKYMSARNKLIGKTPLSAWAWDESPLSTLYLMGKAFYSGIKPKRPNNIDGFLSNLRDENKKKRKDIDKRYGEDGKKPSAGAGTPIWDSEKYWNFIGRVKANYADKWRRTLEKIKDGDAETLNKHYKDGVYFDTGLTALSTMPYTGTSTSDVVDKILGLYGDSAKRLDNYGPKETKKRTEMNTYKPHKEQNSTKKMAGFAS